MGTEDWSCFAAELAHLSSWAEIASQEPLTRHLYDAHDRSMSWDVTQALWRALQ
jgi:hypothetical protein